MTWYPYIAPVPPDVVWSGSVALTVPVVAGLLGCGLLLVFALRAHLHAAVGASVPLSHHKPENLPRAAA